MLNRVHYTFFHLKKGREVYVSVVSFDLCQNKFQWLLLSKAKPDTFILQKLVVAHQILSVAIYFQSQIMAVSGLNSCFSMLFENVSQNVFDKFFCRCHKRFFFDIFENLLIRLLSVFLFYDCCVL